jgi:NAD(P)-dependent dehydrogenase (short-subunit alcohol dehydrogenase family)
MTGIATRRIGVLTGLLVTGLLTVLPAAARAATVMITGANSGIGLEFARQYAAKGWTVIATHRRAEPPQTLTDLLTGKNAGPEGAVFYRLSKAALNREMQLVAAATKKDGVTVVMFNPGPTLTEHQEYLHSYSGMLTTAFTVGNMIKTIDKATLADTGRFLRYDGAVEPW